MVYGAHLDLTFAAAGAVELSCNARVLCSLLVTAGLSVFSGLV